MVTSSSTKASARRWFPRWIVVLLALLLLAGLGSDLHGQDCTCAGNSTEICLLCELHVLDSALVSAVLPVRSPFMEEPAYVLPISERLVLTDLDKDHPPPRQGLAG